MFRSRRSRKPSVRTGVVLLVVISLLVLFALVGIAFVVYAEAQANTSRIWREGEQVENPDMDPEMLLAYFLGQFIYDTDNPLSALRGHSLARNMYGGPGGTIPFSGSGRRPNAPLDLTAYNGVAQNPDDPAFLSQYGSPNPPYTYPDFNHMYLGAQRGGDGVVLVPSYYRPNPAGGPPITLRPNAAYHGPQWQLTDLSGDVKNLADSAGYNNGPNDSIWIDLGFPVMIGADGRKFKPLFAPLIIDLDNRLNVNSHGNIRYNNTQPTKAQYAGGEMAVGPWEVNLQAVLTASDRDDDYDQGDASLYPEARRIFTGRYAYLPSGIKGRYQHRPEVDTQAALSGQPGPPGSFWGDLSQRIPAQYKINGGFNVGSGCWDSWSGGLGTLLPGFNGTPNTSAVPYFDHGNGNDGDIFVGSFHSNHPTLYSYFMPELNYYLPSAKDRTFKPYNMEALLRYGDSGSPALSSDLFMLCPQSFTSAKARRLITTHAFDVDRAGAMPWLWNAPQATPLRLANGSLYPSGPSVPFPPAGTSLSASEFTQDWRSQNAGLGRINLNRDLPWGALPAYPMINNGRMTDFAQFDKAVKARQQFANDIFTVARLITGAADPNTVGQGPEFDALRWLAQLSVNIVDIVDRDDFITPFEWKKGHWVYGTELPRLVVTEAYAEASNSKCNFWVELYNPWWHMPVDWNGWMSYNGGQDGVLCNLPPDFLFTHASNGDDHVARLQVPTGPNGEPAYAAYNLVIATPVDDTALRKPNNVLGDPDPSSIKLTVSDFSPEPAPAPQPVADANIVRPKEDFRGGSNGDQADGNRGWYVLGPKDDFPGTDPNRPKATLRVKSQTINGQKSALVYDLPAGTNAATLKHTILLKRLCCPNMPPQPDPAQPFYNPYVTVDYMSEVPTNDGSNMATVEQRYSVGRNQPYAADKTQQNPQKPLTALTGQPQHTFFKTNVQVIDPNTGKGQTDPPPLGDVSWPYDWLVHMDRQLVSPIELLQVSGFKPHELTQQFMLADPQTGKNDPQGKPLQKFQHRAPWTDPSARIYRLFEFLTARAPLQWEPAGGRITGKINLNTVWDKDIWDAIANSTYTQFYSGPGPGSFLDDCWFQMLRQRTASPVGLPGPGDRPFKGFATPYVPLAMGDPQYPLGIGIEDTFLAPDARYANDPNPSLRNKRLFEPKNDPAQLRPDANDHPFIKSWFLRKICSHCTTRSNVFAVYLTVGFFEVVDDSNPNAPPKLGQEINRSSNRHIRHRMLAIVDRSNISMAIDPQTGKYIPGPRPFFMPSASQVPDPGPVAQAYTIDVPRINGTYEGMPWSINPGDFLVADTGLNQEVIQVTGLNAAPAQLTANFKKPHGARFALSNATLGNPGPQPRFDMRNPMYQGIIRYFSIVQ
jgi:hypothetical protein